MGLINVIKNEVKAAISYQQGFTELLASKDVTRALSMMRCWEGVASRNLRVYETFTHNVMDREDRAVYTHLSTSINLWMKPGSMLQ